MVEVPADFRTGEEQIAAGGDELLDLGLLGGVERVVGGRFLAEDPDHGVVVGEIDGAADDRLVAGAGDVNAGPRSA